jgi:hypothetical protein
MQGLRGVKIMVKKKANGNKHKKRVSKHGFLLEG